MDRVASVSDADVKERKPRGSSSSKKRHREKKEKHMSSGDVVSDKKVERGLARSTSLRDSLSGEKKAKKKSSSRTRERHAMPKRSQTMIASSDSSHRESKRKRSAPAATLDGRVRRESGDGSSGRSRSRSSKRERAAAEPMPGQELETKGGLDEEMVALVEGMQQKMELLQAELAASNEDNAQLAAKVVSLNRDIRSVQGSLKTLSKQHADEVVDRFRQYDQAFSLSLLHLQKIVEGALASTKTAVTAALEEVMEKHKGDMDAALRANLEKVVKAGDEHVADLKKELGVEVDGIRERTKAAQEEYIATINSAKERATFVSEPSEVTASLVERLVKEAVAAQLPVILEAARGQKVAAESDV